MTDLRAVMAEAAETAKAAHRWTIGGGAGCECGERCYTMKAHLDHLTAVTHAAQLQAIRPLIEAQASFSVQVDRLEAAPQPSDRECNHSDGMYYPAECPLCERPEDVAAAALFDADLAREQIARAIAEALNDSVNQRLAGPDMLESLPDEWSVEAQEIAAALLDGPNPLVVPTSPGMTLTLRGLAEIDARWRADLAPLLALHAPHQLATSVSSIHTALGEHLPIRTTYRTVCRYCSPNDSMAAWPCPTIAALPERLRGHQ